MHSLRFAAIKENNHFSWDMKSSLSGQKLCIATVQFCGGVWQSFILYFSYLLTFNMRWKKEVKRCSYAGN